jgi:ataxin-3
LLYHEKQEAGLCAVHALNSLLQGSVFTEIDLMEIAHSLDRVEREVMAAGGLDSADYLRFMARDSSNVSEDGNFSIQVIEKALERRGLGCVPLADSRAVDATADAAFLLHLHSHWIAVRRVHARWWNFNSLLRTPRALSDFYVALFVEEMIRQGYSVFRIVGAMPAPERMTPNGRTLHGRWFAIAFDGKGKPTFLSPLRPDGVISSDNSDDEDEGRKVGERGKRHEIGTRKQPPRAAKKRQEETNRQYEKDLEAAIAQSAKEAKEAKARSEKVTTTRLEPPESDLELALALSLSEQQQQQQGRRK